jgi:hypothetical protein
LKCTYKTLGLAELYRDSATLPAHDLVQNLVHERNRLSDVVVANKTYLGVQYIHADQSMEPLICIPLPAVSRDTRIALQYVSLHDNELINDIQQECIRLWTDIFRFVSNTQVKTLNKWLMSCVCVCVY